MFARIAALVGVKTPAAAWPSIEEHLASPEAQLRATQDALARAHQSVIQIGLDLDAERRARAHAEGEAQADRAAREEALHLLEEAVEALRDAKAAVTEERSRSEEHGQALYELRGEVQALQAQLSAAQAGLAQEVDFAAALRRELDDEQQGRHIAEEKAQTEQHAREEAFRALLDLKDAADDGRLEDEARARDHAELEEKYVHAETRLREIETTLVDALALSERLRIENEAERLARVDAETRAASEKLQSEATLQTLLEAQYAAAELRVRNEEQALAHAELTTQHKEAVAQLKETEALLARARYAAHRHAQRHAQIASDLERERRTREDDETPSSADSDREQAAETLSQRSQESGFLNKILHGVR